DPEQHIISRNNTASLGIAKTDALQTLSVYPNPGKDVVRLNIPYGVEMQSVEVFNALGQSVLRDNDDTLEVSALATGVHLIRVNTDSGTKTLRFVRQ